MRPRLLILTRIIPRLGRKFLAASIPERKEVFRAQIEQLMIFKDTVSLPVRAEHHEVDQDVILRAGRRNMCRKVVGESKA